MWERPLNVCVLGGTGFVGSELVARLVREQHWVRVPTRNMLHGDTLRVLDRVELCVANVHDSLALGDLFRGMDVVVNLIGILNQHGRSTFRKVHADLAARVVAAAALQQVPRLLHMSSLGASPQGPSRYLRSKAQAEAFVRAAPSTLATTIFRPSVIFGQGDSLTNRFAGLLRMSRGLMPLARASARFAPIHVLDVVEAFLRALQRHDTAGETYELCGPEILTLKQIVLLTAQAAGLPARIIPLPDVVGRAQAAILGLLPGKPFSSDNFRSLTVDSVCQDNGCARLGITPRPMLAELSSYLGR
jgi:NADH dehydrogenase